MVALRHSPGHGRLRLRPNPRGKETTKHAKAAKGTRGRGAANNSPAGGKRSATPLFTRGQAQRGPARHENGPSDFRCDRRRDSPAFTKPAVSPTTPLARTFSRLRDLLQQPGIRPAVWLGIWRAAARRAHGLDLDGSLRLPCLESLSGLAPRRTAARGRPGAHDRGPALELVGRASAPAQRAVHGHRLHPLPPQTGFPVVVRRPVALCVRRRRLRPHGRLPAVASRDLHRALRRSLVGGLPRRFFVMLAASAFISAAVQVGTVGTSSTAPAPCCPTSSAASSSPAKPSTCSVSPRPAEAFCWCCTSRSTFGRRGHPPTDLERGFGKEGRRWPATASCFRTQEFPAGVASNAPSTLGQTAAVD